MGSNISTDAAPAYNRLVYYTAGWYTIQQVGILYSCCWYTAAVGSGVLRDDMSIELMDRRVLSYIADIEAVGWAWFG